MTTLEALRQDASLPRQCTSEDLKRIVEKRFRLRVSAPTSYLGQPMPMHWPAWREMTISTEGPATIP